MNDLSSFPNDEILHDYARLLDTLSLPVIVCGILPVDERDRPLFADYNRRIRELNDGLKQLCEVKPQRFFIDSGSHLTDEVGQLTSQYHIGDGVHLSAAGYQIWIAELRDALESNIQTCLVP